MLIYTKFKVQPYNSLVQLTTKCVCTLCIWAFDRSYQSVYYISGCVLGHTRVYTMYLGVYQAILECALYIWCVLGHTKILGFLWHKRFRQKRVYMCQWLITWAIKEVYKTQQCPYKTQIIVTSILTTMTHTLLLYIFRDHLNIKTITL